MKKLQEKIIPLFLPCIYCTFCLTDILLCLIYKFNHDTKLGSICADIVLGLTSILSIALFIVIPLNIFLSIEFIQKITKKNLWKHLIISTLILVFFCIFAASVFVKTTGGV